MFLGMNMSEPDGESMEIMPEDLLKFSKALNPDGVDAM